MLRSYLRPDVNRDSTASNCANTADNHAAALHAAPEQGNHDVNAHTYGRGRADKPHTKNKRHENEKAGHAGESHHVSVQDRVVDPAADEPLPISSTYKESALLFPDAYVAAFEPKVQVPYRHLRGRIPRRIEIERRRRRYDGQSFEHLISISGLTLNGLARQSNQQLPIQLFDDVSYESRNPDDWMAIAAGNPNPRGRFLPAEGIYHCAEKDTFSIQPCRVMQWDVERNELGVRWGAVESAAANRLCEPDDAERGEQRPDKTVMVPRILVRLLADDPVVHVQRLVNAHHQRDKATKWIMYRLCCYSMPTEGLTVFDDGLVERLRQLSTRTPQLSEAVFPEVQSRVEELLKELTLIWQRSHNSILLHDRMRNDEAVLRMVAGTTEMNLNELMSGPNVAIQRSDRGNPRTVLRVCEDDFAAREQSFTFSTYFTQPEVVGALTGVRRECIRVLERVLFDLPRERQMTLEVFRRRQAEHMQSIATYLKGPWLQKICQVIMDSFGDAGKGWLNVREVKQDVYEMSKLKKFFTTVKFMMEDILFELVYTSLHRFTEFMEEVSEFYVEVVDRDRVTNRWPGSDADDCVEKQPLFTIHLVEREDHFAYSVSFDDFEQTLVELFNTAIRCTEAIPQVERYVMSQYFWRRDGDGPFLRSVTQDDERVCGLRDRLRRAIRGSLEPLQSYLHTYDELRGLVRLNKTSFIQTYAAEEHSLEAMKDDILSHLSAKKTVAEYIPAFLTVGNFVVDCHSFGVTMAKKEEDLARLIMQLIAKLARQQSAEIREEFNKMVRVLEKEPQTPEKLFELYGFIDTLPNRVTELNERIDTMRQYYVILDGFQYELNDDESRQKWEAIGWPRQLARRTQAVRKQLEQVQEELHNRLQKEQEEFAKTVEQLQRVVATFSRYTDSSQADRVAAEVKTRNIEIRQCIDTARAINSDQRLFSDKLTDYRNVFELDKEFKPYSDLWLTTYTWQESYRRWHADAFDTLDADEIESTVTTAFKTMTALSRTFKDKAATLKIVEEVRQAVEQMKPWVPLITSLRHPGMKERHWAELSAKLGRPLVPGDTLLVLDDCEPLLAYKDTIVSFGEVAAKESQIERLLKEMRGRWEGQFFVVEPYKETGTYILKDTSEVVEILDEHLNLTQQLQFSPFRAYFEEAIVDWERSLNLLSDVLEQWMECQRTWRYLEPIFSSEDMAMQLPKLSRLFDKVDKTWRRVMGNVHAKPNVLEFCIGTSKLLDHLREANRNLEEVQRGLNDYLAEKRQSFPRFYFLSDEELLEILSQTKEVRRIDANIAKLFEFIARLEWNDDNDSIDKNKEATSAEGAEALLPPPSSPSLPEDDAQTDANALRYPDKDAHREDHHKNDIVGFYSSEGEHVGSVQSVSPVGNVEHWLRLVETMMKEAVHHQIELAYRSYMDTPRTRWVLDWSAQAVIAVSQIIWTQSCEAALQSDGSLADYDAVLQQQLFELVDVVQSPLTAMQRVNMGALITIEVHAKDTVDGMRRNEVQDIQSFDWMKQLRFYFDPSDSLCHIRQVDAHFVYGGEYLGNTGRLVITPLTDRIYLTLTGALALCLGGAPAGPAGTGKTETTKDLAKALAKQCVVFNCQEGMTYLSMGKFFKGLAQAGAWACFDEFNRIDVEVLSVVAQQVTDLQHACLTKQLNIHFEGSEIVVDPTHAVFITMNPGYAGRTELPDNLKVLFRPVACMVPDYAMIGEIRLFSYGYKKARALAQKMVATFRLSSEQLSSQDHYDFGMRAVNTVIAAAGLNKRESSNGGGGSSGEEEEVPEEVLLLRALRDSNMPKFLADDVLLFDGIVRDLFPGVSLSETDYGDIVSALHETITARQLQPVPAFIHKCLQLYDITTLRHGLMLVGPAGGGKTTAYTALQTALTRCTERQAAGEELNSMRTFMKVYTHICNPKSVTMDQLYGAYDENGEWSDGVLCVLFRRAARYGDESDAGGATMYGKNWVIFDGPVDALWIESMNTVLDDNKKLCLVSGEIIQMNRDMTMMFEVEDLAVASPATVSRCGMIYLDPHTCVPLTASIATWLRSLPAAMQFMTDTLETLALTYLPTMIDFVREQLREYVSSTHGGLAHAFFRMMNGFVYTLVPRGGPMNAGAAATGRRPAPAHTSPGRTGARRGLAGAAAAAAAAAFSSSTGAGASAQPPSGETDTLLARVLPPLFFFSLIWSVGATCDEAGRVQFSARLRALAQDHGHSSLLPPLTSGASTRVSPTPPNTDGSTPTAVGGGTRKEEGGEWRVETDSVYDHSFRYPVRVAKEGGGNGLRSRRDGGGGENTAAYGSSPAGMTGGGAAAAADDKDGGEGEDEVGWVHWNDTRPPFEPSKDTRFDDILVPTVDHTRQCYLLRHLLSEKVHVAAVGPTGTGKSVAVAKLVLGGGMPDYFLGLHFTFSAQTRAFVVQNSLMSKLDKRRSHVFGAPMGKHFLLFVDDANLPQKERYGAQPPLELLRQLIGQGGFYSFAAPGIHWSTIIDTSLVMAMGPPGAGRSSVSNRLMRFFNLISFPEMTDESKRDIMRTILHVGAMQNNLAEELRRLGDDLISSTLRIFHRCCQTFLPTPAHVHYAFNMRDVMRVFPMLYRAQPATVPHREALVTLWMHETQRVFYDRLINDADKATLIGFLNEELVAMGFQGDYDALTKSERLIFTNVCHGGGGGGGGGGGAGDRYEQVVDVASLTARLTEALCAYNEENETRMDLVLFLDAAEHVCRIARVLQLPNGNCLLLGVGGSGRKSLTRLACYVIPEMDIFTVEIVKNYGLKEWHESLAKLLLECGKDDKRRTFLLSDTQLVHPSFLEEVAGLITSGDVPNLFEEQDMELIHEKFRAVCIAESLPTTKVSIYARFVKEVRANLHLVLAFSPIGEAFRTRMRMFPSLIANCTIDWFAEWPAEALLSVARAQLLCRGEDILLPTSAAANHTHADGDGTSTRASLSSTTATGEEKDASLHVPHATDSSSPNRPHRPEDDNLHREQPSSPTNASSPCDTVAACAQYFHRCAADVTDAFFRDTHRRSYVTPTSYLTLLGNFTSMVTSRRQRLRAQRSRLENGLEQLRATETRVAELEAELRAQQPVLETKKEEIRVIMERLVVDRRHAAVQESEARKEESAAAAQAEECAKMRRECAGRLAKAEPALAEAVKMLSKIKAAEITELNKYQNPPKGVQYVMEAVALLLTFGNCPKEFYSGPPGGRKVPDWWMCAKSYMRDANRLLDTLVQPPEKGGFNREAMDMALMEKVRAYYDNEEFQPDKVRSVSVPCMVMCLWVRAMYKWFFVNREIQPLREKLAAAEVELAEGTAALRRTRATLDAVVAAMAALEEEYASATSAQVALEAQMEHTAQKLQRAARLIDGLGGEKVRWMGLVRQLYEQERCIVGDMLIAAATVAYSGPLTAPYREALLTRWWSRLREAGVATSAAADLVSTMGDAVQIQEWQLCGLPTDRLSTENILILTNSRNWPLLIDPQGQANMWIRNVHQEDNLQVCKASDERFMKTVESSIRLGLPCLIENVGHTLEAALEPVLLRNIFLIGSTPHVRIGDSAIPYDNNFKLYMTTKLPNPSYSPETIVTVSLLNFFITPSGLEEQLLGKAVEKERADLEQEKQRLTRESAAKQGELNDLQHNILRMLEEVEGDILDQEELILTLEKSKSKSVEINADLAKAKETERVIDETRNKYRPHAERGSLLFFCAAQLSMIDPMYQFSLQWFIHLFLNAVDQTERAETVEERVRHLIDVVTYSFYANVCRSLFEQHKLSFSFYLCTRVIEQRGELDEAEWRFLLTGPTSTVTADTVNPAPDWLTESSWNEIVFASRALPSFAGFAPHVRDRIDHYRALFDSAEADTYPLAAGWSAQATPSSASSVAALGGDGEEEEEEGVATSETPLQRLIAMRCFRKDKLAPAIQHFVKHYLGACYIVAPQFDLADAYKDSNCLTPLIFINSPGSDPMQDLLRFAETMRMTKKLDKVSLGQGQGRRAEELIVQGRDKGQWVLLQNCHLATSWMPTLEAIVESFTMNTVKKEFRLWLTSMPCDAFPVAVLQIAVKMTNEPPMGLRTNVARSYTSMNDNRLTHAEKDEEFRTLVFALCVFHAVIQERRKFGSLGFNIPYEFNDSDRDVCVLQLRKFLSLYSRVPFDVLTFLTGEINYGGRVTDDWDRRCLMTIITRFFCPDVLTEGYAFSPSGVYHTIEPGDCAHYLRYLDTWPLNPKPEIFGLHENADITCAQNTSQSILSTVLTLVSRGGGGSSSSGGSGEVGSDSSSASSAPSSRDSETLTLVSDIQSRLPMPFNVSEFAAKYPTRYSESMNTVLVQEAVRYNRLLSFVHRHLAEFAKATRGEVVMSAELEAVGASFAVNAVPAAWTALAYPSLKPLSSWVLDLVRRVEFIQDWYDHGAPNTFWLGGFFFPQAFLTGTLQNYARAVQAAIDTISFSFHLLDTQADGKQAVRSKPEKGAIVYGLFMEGARWCDKEKTLCESRPKELYVEMPMIHLDPVIQRVPNPRDYVCPVYKTLARAGTLSTTGHSTNFVLCIEIPTKVDPPHWVERGVACIVSLNF